MFSRIMLHQSGLEFLIGIETARGLEMFDRTSQSPCFKTRVPAACG